MDNGLSLDALRGWVRGQKHPELIAVPAPDLAKGWNVVTPADSLVLRSARGDSRSFVSLDSLVRFVQELVATPCGKAVDVRISVLTRDLLE